MADTMDVSDEPELLTTETVVEYVKELLANKPNLLLDLSGCPAPRLATATSTMRVPPARQ